MGRAQSKTTSRVGAGEDRAGGTGGRFGGNRRGVRKVAKANRESNAKRSGDGATAKRGNRKGHRRIDSDGRKRLAVWFPALGIRQLFKQRVIKPPIEWIEENVDLSNDPTSASDGKVKLDPYQIEPILAQFEEGVQEVVVMAPPQTGKSFVWRLPLVYKIVFIDGPRWIMYESDDKAEDINAQQFDPLIKSIPELKQRLDDAGRFSAVRRQYRFPTGPVDFSGAGSEPTSKPERDGVFDELDTAPLTNAQKRKTLNSFRDRFVTWWAIGEGCLVIVSSPNGQDSEIGRQHKTSSRGFWHLRCLGCRQLSLVSHQVANMQWNLDENGSVIVDSIRLVCPDCNRQHAESEAVEMNRQGGYVHQDNGNRRRRGFQWGALASPRTRSWQFIAESQMAAGSGATLEDHENFAKVVRGLPYRPKMIRRDAVEAVRLHCGPLPPRDQLCGVIFVADTQDNGWWWIARGLYANRSTALLGYGKAANEDALIDAWDAEYEGVQAVIGIIDEGGHLAGDVVEIVKDRAGLYTYKGDNRQVRWSWQREDKTKKRTVANAKFYQSDLLYLMHVQTKTDANYWWIPEGVSDEYASQLASVQPDNKSKNGHHFENWCAPDGADDHYFDCEKMFRFAVDFAGSILKPRHWLIPPPWIYRTANRQRRQSEVNL